MRFEQHRSAKTTNLLRNRKFSVAGRRRLIALAAAAALAMAPGTGLAQGVTDVVLGSGSFQIPFNIAAGGSQPREVHLYMATPAGTPAESNRGIAADTATTTATEPGEWRLLDRQSPSVGQFQVSETPDGTFWFATRTIDSSGRPHPPGPIDPELKVTVDTTQPVVDLIAEADADGKVTASFAVEDATGASQITVHYVTDTLQQWQTARVDRTEEGGRFSFEPTDQWQQLSLRLRVLDRAGNETIVKKRVQKPRVAVAASTRFASSPLGAGNPLYGNPASQPPANQHLMSPQYPAGPQYPAPPQSANLQHGISPYANAPYANTPYGAPPQTNQPNNTPLGYSNEAPSIYSSRPRVGAPGVGVPAINPQINNPQIARNPATATLAGNSPALPLPSTADQISQDFGRSAPGIEMLPNASTFGTEMLPTPPAEAPAPAPAKTPAEAMRPLDVTPQMQPASAQPTAAQPSAAPPAARSTTPAAAPATPRASTPRASTPRTSTGSTPAAKQDNATPQTPFVTESIPAPEGQRPAPTQLNRPATPEVDESKSETDPVPSPWSPVDSNRTRNPSRQFSTKPETRPVAPGQLPLDSTDTASREQRRVPVTSVDPLNLERLAQRAVVRHSDSNQFSLDYEIEAIGGRGVEEIELYGTTDGGQTWKKWGSDPDKVSPFDIETNGEGIFGFQIVVVASNGLKSPSPLAGDAPDIVVVVDQTDPVVGISGAKYGEGDRAGSLVIAYHCEDRYLTSRPITLAFSDSPSGPWTTIAAGLRNIGDYVWPADPQLPRQIYLRIDATDQAGNVGGYVLEEPIDTRGLAPRARIRAFRSIPTR